MFRGKFYGDNKEYQLNGQKSPLKTVDFRPEKLDYWALYKRCAKQGKGTIDINHQSQESLNIIQKQKGKNVIN